MKGFILRRLVSMMCISGLIGASTNIYASGFQIFEQDAATIGNYHAGYVSEAKDASTVFYNPAGITRFTEQQTVFGADTITTDFKYRGSVRVTEFTDSLEFNSVTAQGGTFNLVPFLHYIAPISDWLGFGLSVNIPFGLKTDYGQSTPLRYAATLTSITVVDVSPALGFKLNDHASFGVALDVQRAFAEFNSVAVSLFNPDVDSDTSSINKANDTAYGYHLGGLYEFNKNTRVGVSYHSQVVHHLTGSSTFSGPIAEALDYPDGFRSNHARTTITLPPYAAISGFHRLNERWTLMGSATYTKWSTFKQLVLNGVAGVAEDPETLIALSKDIQVVVPEHYRNTWNFSVGADYHATDTIILRGGVGYDQTPVRNSYRNVQLPDNNRYVLALGGHFQATQHVAVDVGWTHLFVSQAKVNPPTLQAGIQNVTTQGTVTGGADVLGGQIVWDIV